MKVKVILYNMLKYNNLKYFIKISVLPSAQKVNFNPLSHYLFAETF